MKLNNKRYNVIVTGGNQGLGLAIAKKFVLEGYNTLLVARDLEKLIIAREKLLKLKSCAFSFSTPESCFFMRWSEVRTD